MAILGMTNEEILAFERWFDRYIDDDLREYIDRLDDFDRKFFFAYLHREMGRECDMRVIRQAQRRVAGLRQLDEDERAPLPFSEAESSISTGRWFGGSLVTRMMGYR